MMAFVCMALVLFLLDMMIKQWVVETIDDKEERTICGGRLILRKVYNEGIALNGFDQHPQMVRNVSVLAGLGLLLSSLILLIKKGRRVEKVGMMVLTGGAWSNITDRVLRRKVVDYLAFPSKHQKVSRITFNLGDVCILLGTLLVWTARLFCGKNRK